MGRGSTIKANQIQTPGKSPATWRTRLDSIDRTDLALYVLTVLLVIGLKYSWRDCRPTEPRVFLGPIVALLELVLGSPFQPQPDGYWNGAWRVLVAKGCGGMNYFLIAHCLLVFTHLRSLRGRGKIPAYTGFFIAAYILSTAANTSRILSAVMLGRLLPAVLTGRPHLALGTLVYFFFLLAGNWLAGLCLTFIHKGNGIHPAAVEEEFP